MPVTIPQVVRELQALPPERVAEVYDFVLFLKSRIPVSIDVSDEWTDEDMRDAVNAGLRYADQTALSESDENGAR